MQREFKGGIYYHLQINVGIYSCFYMYDVTFDHN